MQWIAIRSDLQPMTEMWKKYVHKQDVACETCKETTYQLWAPLELAQDDALIKDRVEALQRMLVEECPSHPDWFEVHD